jgi:adenylate cyclase class IV
MEQPRRNIELTAHDPDPVHSLEVCRTLGAEDNGEIWQRDTYFQVAKRRRLFLWRDVRIHLDDVEQLGRFIELEAVAPSESDLTHEHNLVVELRDAFDITDERLIAIGYAEQLMRARVAGGRCETPDPHAGDLESL